MRLYLYKNNFCDPGADPPIGTARQFTTAKQVDDYIKFFVASLNPEYINQWRAFVTDDTVQFQELDHYVMFDGDNLNIGQDLSLIHEINLWNVAIEVNQKLKANLKRIRDTKLTIDQQIRTGEAKGLLEEYKHLIIGEGNNNNGKSKADQESTTAGAA